MTFLVILDDVLDHHFFAHVNVLTELAERVADILGRISVVFRPFEVPGSRLPTLPVKPEAFLYNLYGSEINRKNEYV